MKRVIKLPTPPRFISYGAVGGREEGEGPLGSLLDMCDPTSRFGADSWEMAESEMARLALNISLAKIKKSHTVLDLIVAGDLQNQCVSSSLAALDLSVPYISLYGACSTCTEGLLVLSSLLSLEGGTGAVLTSSHNSAAERQFRTPLEYGAQRTPTSQWTATASGAFILSTDEQLIKDSRFGNVIIEKIMVGKMQSGAITDGANMGGAMAFAAADSIITYFSTSGDSPEDYDLIVTGDLGRVGSSILCQLLDLHLPSARDRHTDCGLLLYDMNMRDAHSGASGCGCSAAVLSCHILPLLERGALKNVLFLSTGALMSPSSVLQGQSIVGIAPAVHLKYKPYENKEDNKNEP